MLIILLPALIALIGLVMMILYIPPPARGARIGEILFFTGMLVVCFLLAKVKLGLP